MSLIEEALRRAEHNRPPPPKRHPTPAEPSIAAAGGVATAPSLPGISLISEATQPASPAPVAPAMTSWNASAVRWLRLGIVGTGVVAMMLWTYHVTVGSRPLVVSAPPAPHKTEIASAALPSEPAPDQPPEPVFVLNGVVGGVGEPFAIINGTIVHLGETIDEATLLRVDSEAATLRRKGKTFVLRTAK